MAVLLQALSLTAQLDSRLPCQVKRREVHDSNHPVEHRSYKSFIRRSSAHNVRTIYPT